MFLQTLYLFFFVVLAVLSIYSITAGWRRKLSRRSRGGVRPHPELLDRQGRMIRDPLLVVKVTPRDTETRRWLESIYNNSPDNDERQPRR
jgi:hypothetical protein